MRAVKIHYANVLTIHYCLLQPKLSSLFFKIMRCVNIIVHDIYYLLFVIMILFHFSSSTFGQTSLCFCFLYRNISDLVKTLILELSPTWSTNFSVLPFLSAFFPSSEFFGHVYKIVGCETLFAETNKTKFTTSWSSTSLPQVSAHISDTPHKVGQ